jgi:ABC-type phosphate transport system substrate-binding protein
MCCAARTPSGLVPLIARAAALLIVALGAISCQSIPTPVATSTPTAVPVLQLGFDEALRPLMHATMPIYADEHPLAVVETRAVDATALMTALRAGEIAAAVVPGTATGDVGGWVSAIGVDGLAIIANPENQLTSLTMHQVQSIFQGRLWSWGQAGGADGEIEVVTWAPGSAMVQLLREKVLGDRPVTLTAVVMPDTDSVLEYVGSRPGAIGYVSAAAVNGRVKVLAVDGVYPAVETLSDRTYPLYYPISFVAPAEPQGPLRDFATWVLSHDGQAVIGQIYGRVR